MPTTILDRIRGGSLLPPYITNMLRPSVFMQLLFPSRPTFTEKQLPDLGGHVYLITGANTGVGRELARLLYGAHATVYLACRSAAKAEEAIHQIQAETPASPSSATGRLEFLELDLADLGSVRRAVHNFCARESRLDVLFNNAGVLVPPPGSASADAGIPRTAQGYGLEMGVNCLGHFCLARLLTPLLVATAASRPRESPPPRVVWVSSSGAELFSFPDGGLDMAILQQPDSRALYDAKRDPLNKYGDSKAGNYLHGTEFARRHRADGIISVACNPGNLRSDVFRSLDTGIGFGVHRFLLQLVHTLFLYPPVYGAYTELFCGLSPDVTLKESGSWIGPWGAFYPIRSDLEKAAKPKSEGGTGVAEEFWDWCEEQVKLHS